MSQQKYSLPEVKSLYNDLEQPILTFWKENNIFEKSIDIRSDKNQFVFYDGPPFVTGTPHYGHLLSSILKDIVPRYQTMLGKRVERVWGWDCHGLPVEEKVERTLGTKNRREIEQNIGIQKFIDACFHYVQDTSAEWPWYVDRIARWVDMKNAYRTMDKSYMESVIWAFKQLHEKNMVYKGKRVSLYCTRCGTPISSFEVAMDNSYADLEDPSVYMKFKLKNFNVGAKQTNDNDVYAVAWTTTPWTLPENAALAIDEEQTYVTVQHNETKEYLVLAKERVEAVFKDKNVTIINEYSGKELLGTNYEPLFSYFTAGDNDHKIYAAKFVSMSDGSGIVHVAPGFGEDDTELGKVNKLSMFDGVDDEGKLVAEVTDFAGMYIKDADERILENLKSRNLVLRAEKFTHSYPLCYRCKTPLIYKAQESWYIDVTSIKPQLEENNENVNWVPDHIKHGRFLAGVKSAPDWGVSRTRYWATPMPIWECDECDHREILGSIAEIEAKSGKTVTDLHRPYIDEHTYKCEKCEKGRMKRIEEVIDCWLESASMPFAQLHYPFENKEKFEATFPGDYIVEYVPQTRAWFYVMHVVATALFGKNAFKNVICHGTINGSDGRKMSKSYGNYPDPKGVIEDYGGDALRLYIASSVLPNGEDANVSEEAIAGQTRDVLLPLLNVYKYFALYANQHDFTPDTTHISQNILDKWIIARAKQATVSIKESLDAYQIQKATSQLKPLLDDVSTWYIRRSRDRFVAGEKDALNTLFMVIYMLITIFAPIIPFTTEFIYQQLKKALGDQLSQESIHHELINVDVKVSDDEQRLLENMQKTRDMASLALSIRDEKNLPLKQPLGTLQIVAESLDTELQELIKGEINVEELLLVKDKTQFSSDFAVKENEKAVVALNTTISEELQQKGMARELTRAIQVSRRTSGLQMGQLAHATVYSNSEEIEAIVTKFSAELKTQTSLSEISFVKTGNLDEIEGEIGKIKQGTIQVKVKTEA